ncbi:hypothetical protein ACFLEY_22800 [Bradyrhizobium sp. YCK136]|jgi:hypothetical protein|uniref:Uncharacterized protein n=1 Tax=Bradyrhizobium elkanii TaxID=29448 RepID=A0ABV4F0B4_BRAEL|nr:hypothetical protein [Bradyrhizobium elkanii]MCP1757884.1 hypothetical protein [Bradyrhizobium elkanii]MCS3881819.1 hypothetical protein [Bradyrhizobium elkanii]MCS4218578.1 hypothetical protein [Bradyrhizobium elkanii]MCW2110125.1 hypothetical protein [Bradyrhizobium elkanii]MCW2201506.1 hypothetical protein [Bradyrhizobium elkanii]
MFIDPRDVVFFSDDTLTKALENRGYRVIPPGLPRENLTWNRVEPFPKGINFKDEALGKIKDQIRMEHLEFTSRAHPWIDRKCQPTTQMISTACLRIYR